MNSSSGNPRKRPRSTQRPLSDPQYMGLEEVIRDRESSDSSTLMAVSEIRPCRTHDTDDERDARAPQDDKQSKADSQTHTPADTEAQNDKSHFLNVGSNRMTGGNYAGKRSISILSKTGAAGDLINYGHIGYSADDLIRMHRAGINMNNGGGFSKSGHRKGEEKAEEARKKP